MAANVDKWYFTRQQIEENSPSRRDGVSLKKENKIRKKYTRFISETCQKFRIPKIVNATANLYCQRFFLQRSLAKHKWYRIAIACLFLASKVEEHRIRLADLKKERWRETLKEVFKEEIPYKEHKEMIGEDETEILAAINFGISVDHPEKYFFKVVRKLQGVPKEVCLAASEFIDNSYFSSLCLQFKPHKIAGAAFHLSYKCLKLQLPFQEEEEGYREYFQMTLNELEDISSQIMDLYEYRRPPQAAPDDQSASSSSSSTSAPSPLPAAPSKKRMTVLRPRPPAPGKESFTELMPPPRAPDKKCVPASSHQPDAAAEHSLPASSLLPAEPSNQNPPKPVAPDDQSPKVTEVQSPKSKVLQYWSKMTQPTAPGNQNPPPPVAPGNQIPPAPVVPSNQSPPPPVATNKQNPSTPSTALGKQSPSPPAAPAEQSPPPSAAPGSQSRSAE